LLGLQALAAPCFSHGAANFEVNELLGGSCLFVKLGYGTARNLNQIRSAGAWGKSLLRCAATRTLARGSA
jgi:hypothetical protein